MFLLPTSNTRSPNLEAQTDARLVAMARDGEVSAFGELVERHSRAVYGIVSRMIDRRDEVDDIVQDVFVNAYSHLSAFKGDAAFATWIHRIAVNTTIKQIKRAKVRQAASIDDPVIGLSEVLVSSDGDGPEDAAERKERSAAIQGAIRSLPDKHRAVVVLHYFQDCTCEEIAGIMGCSIGTVWSRLHYACKKLKGQLEWTAGREL